MLTVCEIACSGSATLALAGYAHRCDTPGRTPQRPAIFCYMLLPGFFTNSRSGQCPMPNFGLILN